MLTYKIFNWFNHKLLSSGESFDCVAIVPNQAWPKFRVPMLLYLNLT
jgi:hypothetical protein